MFAIDPSSLAFFNTPPNKIRWKSTASTTTIALSKRMHVVGLLIFH